MTFDFRAPDDFSGVICVKEGGRTLLEAAYGDADMANARPNRLDTRFVTASAGKAFTAAGILTLVEAGRIGLESTLGDLLDFDLGGMNPAVTVRQLLTHTSGIADYADEAVVPDYADLFKTFPCYNVRENRDILPLFVHQPMAYAPGDHLHYNNSGFVMLALVIEAVCGLPFDAYLSQAVFTPCGMLDTAYQEYDRPWPNTANVYIRDEARGDYYTNIYSTTAKGLGDGGAFTTAGDLERFWRGLYGGKVIGPALLAEMTRPQTPERCYGYGLWLEELQGHAVPHFEGCEPGIGCYSAYDASRDLLITLITNRGDNIWRMSRDLLRLFYAGVPERFYYGE